MAHITRWIKLGSLILLLGLVGCTPLISDRSAPLTGSSTSEQPLAISKLGEDLSELIQKMHQLHAVGFWGIKSTTGEKRVFFMRFKEGLILDAAMGETLGIVDPSTKIAHMRLCIGNHCTEYRSTQINPNGLPGGWQVTQETIKDK